MSGTELHAENDSELEGGTGYGWNIMRDGEREWLTLKQCPGSPFMADIERDFDCRENGDPVFKAAMKARGGTMAAMYDHFIETGEVLDTPSE